jgi:hypothetical protein
MTMADLPDQIRAWVDALPSADPVTVEDVVARAGPAPRRPMVWLAAAVLAVAGIGAGLVLALLLDGDAERTTTDRPDRTEVSFTVLGRTEEPSRAPGVLQSASGPEGLAALWSSAGVEGPVPVVDFATRAVVGITIGDDLCPPTLVRFDRDGVELVPVFREPAGACRQLAVSRTFVVALDLATTGPSFRLVLPDRSVEGEGALVLDVRRPGPSGPGVPLVWPVGATDADRSSPEAAARSFLAAVLGSAIAEEAEVVADPGTPADDRVAVDVVVDAARSRVLTAPTSAGWVVLRAGDRDATGSADPLRAQIPAVEGATTVAVSVVTDLGVTVLVERTTTGPTDLDLPPGRVRSVTVVHRALDGRILALDAIGS